MPATANKGYEVQANGSNSGTWGSTLNTNVLTFVDTNLAAVFTQALTNVNVTLSATDARNAMIRLTGTLSGAVQLTNPNLGFWFCENLTTGAFAVTITNTVGSPITLAQNRRAVLFSDGTNGVRILSIASITNPDPAPIGSVMLFMQSAVPSGWTLSTAWNDYGIQLSNATGGVTSGSLGHSVVHQRTQVDSHVMTAAESPKHTHDFTLQSKFTSSGTGLFDGIAEWSASPVSGGTVVGTTSAVGGGQGHQHGFDLRVLTVTGVIGTRAG